MASQGLGALLTVLKGAEGWMDLQDKLNSDQRQTNSSCITSLYCHGQT